MVDEYQDVGQYLDDKYMKHGVDEGSEESKNELEKYLHDDCEKKMPSFDILSW